MGRLKPSGSSCRDNPNATLAGVGTPIPEQAVKPSLQMHRFRSPSYASNRGTSGVGVPTPATILARHGHRVASRSKMDWMSPIDQPSDEQQVGITNAQEKNPDTIIADLTKQMNAHFAAGQYSEAAVLALQITARSKDELRGTFVRHGVTVLYLDHEAFGIYEGQIEPTYDVRVEGSAAAVPAAAAEFGKRHAQEMILIARKLREGEHDPGARLGLTIRLNAAITLNEAVEITGVVQSRGFMGATFATKGKGTMVVYHTDSLGMSAAEFEEAAILLVDGLKRKYPGLHFEVQEFTICMAKL